MIEKFSCIKDGGLELYSKIFKESEFIDSQLLAGFFYAIQSISEELKNPVSFIRLENSIVYFKSYGDFFLILMFSIIPEEEILIKKFEELSLIITENFTDISNLNFSESFNNKIDKALSVFQPESSIFNFEAESFNHKIGIFGLAKAGKTSIKKKFFDRITNDNLKSIRPTIGVEISKNKISYLQESIIVSDFGGQNNYRKIHLGNDNNFIGLSTLIYVIDIQDKSSFNESLIYLDEICNKIKTLNIKKPSIFIYFHKYDENIRKNLYSNVNEALVKFKNYLSESTFFFTSIEDSSSIKAFIKTLFISLPSLVIKQVLHSFLIEMFEEKLIDQIKSYNFEEKDAQNLLQAGKNIGEQVSNTFQDKWLEFYFGNYSINEQLMNTKKIYLSNKGSQIKIEIDNWEKEGISSTITDPFLTGFLKGVFKSLYINPEATLESNKLSTTWKIEINPEINYKN